MKKILSLFIAVIFVFSLSLNVLADYIYPQGELLKSAYELFQYWEEKGYPDYVCGVWSTNGGTNELTIGIIENSYEKGNKAEDLIYLNVKDDKNVTIVYQKHSKNKLLSIMEEMNGYLETHSADTGLMSAGLYDDKNFVEICFKKEKEQDEKTKSFVSMLKEKYKDAINVVYTDKEIIFSATLGGNLQNPSNNKENSEKNGINSVGFWLLPGFCVLFVLAFSVYRKKIIVTSTGEEITDKKYKKSDVEREIKNTPVCPQGNLDKKIQELINK